METTNAEDGGYRAASIALFTRLFAGQAALIAMSPVLTDAASDLDVSTAAAGQLRTLTGLDGRESPRCSWAGWRDASGSGADRRRRARCLRSARSRARSRRASHCSSLAQVPVGVAVAVLTTAGTLAAAEWVAPELRTRTLSWALVGQPAALIVGMPLIGLVGEHSWRYGWLVLPFAAAIAAAALAAPRRGGRPAVRCPARARAALADPHARPLARCRSCS